MNSTEYWKNVFKKLANERNFQTSLEEFTRASTEHRRSFMHLEIQ